MTLTSYPPNDVQMLRSGALPCLACGVAVTPREDRIESFDTKNGGFRPQSGIPGQGLATLTMTRCDECHAIKETADALMTAHHNVRVSIGASSIASHRMECALGALDALGVTDPALIARFTATDADVRLLIDSLLVAGGAARWVTRFVPVLRQGVNPERSAVARWSHLSPEQRETLRDAYGRMLSRRVEVPQEIKPPEDYRGCMLCGIGSYAALRSHADQVWAEASGNTVVLGGRTSPEPIYGVTCPPCTRSISEIGSVGQTAMTKAVMRHLGVVRLNSALLQIDNLRAWALLGERAAPNLEPWAHLDLAGLREALRV